MAQLTNTRVYGKLDVDKCINVQAFTDDPDAVQITDLINRINVNSKLVGIRGNIGSTEYVPASLLFHTYNKNTGFSIYNGQQLTTMNMSSTRFAELSNTAGKFPADSSYNYNNLFSLKLRDHTKKDTVTTRNDTLISEAHTIDDTTFDISLSVTDDFSRASSSKPTFEEGNVASTYNTSNVEGKTVKTTTSTVKVPLTVPSKGGEIITDNTLDVHMRYSVVVSNTTQLTNLLNSSDFKNCAAGFAGADALGVILYAALGYIASGTLPSYPALFYIENNAVYMACFSPSEGIFKKKSSLESGENVRIIVSTKAAYDALKKVIA